MSGNLEMKLVVVGDGAVGKTCLLLSYANNKFPTEYVPTVFENYVVTVTAGEKKIDIELRDTAGQEEYDRIRPLSYPNADVFLLCFSVVNPTSYENITSKWIEEVRHYAPTAQVVLVGTKMDLREDKATLKELKKQSEAPVPNDQGEALAQKINAEKYLECSARTGQNLKEVFDAAIVCFLNRGKKQKKRRCVLA